MIDIEACRQFCERRDHAKSLTSAPLEIQRPMPVLRHEPSAEDIRPPALSRGPCPRCETRGDIGCAHQRAFEAVGLVAFTRNSVRLDRRRFARGADA